MDSNGRTQPLLVGLLIISVIVCLDLELVLSLQSNAYLSERVTFYPASLIVSHNLKPLINLLRKYEAPELKYSSQFH